MPQQTQSGNKIQDCNRELLARKLRSIRAGQSLGVIAKRAGLSREGVRKAESGDFPKLATLRRIAEAAQANEEDSLGLEILWLKSAIGKNAAKIQIKTARNKDMGLSTEDTARAAVLVEHLNELDPEDHATIVGLISSKEALFGLRTVIKQVGPQLSSPYQRGVDEYPCDESNPPIPSTSVVSDDPWADL